MTDDATAATESNSKEKIPLYFRGTGRNIRPGRDEVESVSRRVTIGGVRVRLGDAVADSDGVAVVPRQQAEAVARAARAREDEVRRGIGKRVEQAGKDGRPGLTGATVPCPWAGRGRGRVHPGLSRSLIRAIRGRP